MSFCYAKKKSDLFDNILQLNSPRGEFRKLWGGGNIPSIEDRIIDTNPNTCEGFLKLLNFPDRDIREDARNRAVEIYKNIWYKMHENVWDNEKNYPTHLLLADIRDFEDDKKGIEARNRNVTKITDACHDRKRLSSYPDIDPFLYHKVKKLYPDWDGIFEVLSYYQKNDPGLYYLIKRDILDPFVEKSPINTILRYDPDHRFLYDNYFYTRHDLTPFPYEIREEGELLEKELIEQDY